MISSTLFKCRWKCLEEEEIFRKKFLEVKYLEIIRNILEVKYLGSGQIRIEAPRWQVDTIWLLYQSYVWINYVYNINITCVL